MVRCSENFWDCIPCCDFCIHAKHEEWDDEKGHHIGGPEGCLLHSDKKHQDIAKGCGYCEDFQCFNADKEAGRWFEGE